MIILSFFLIFPHVEAQSPSTQIHLPQQKVSPNLKLNISVVISLLGIILLLTLLLLYFSRFCHVTRPSANNQGNPNGNLRSQSRFSGIDKTVIESLPFFKFSSLKGSREGLECAVCLSKFGDIEVLRMLPKCKHAFHISCIDQWLEQHSSCPLCRSKVSADDLELLAFSRSLRFPQNVSELQEDPSLEICVQREESRRMSSRFWRFLSGARDEDAIRSFRNRGAFDKFKHKIVVSDVVFKNRWSNLSSSDLACLESEMLGSLSSKRFSFFDSNVDEATSVPGNEANGRYLSRVCDRNERRSMSEIMVHTRFDGSAGENENGFRRSLGSENVVGEERRTNIWLPIARRTVEWFGSREKRSQSSHTKRPSNA